MKKIMEIPGGRGSNAKPSGTENPVGRVWIFSGTTHCSGSSSLLQSRTAEQRCAVFSFGSHEPLKIHRFLRNVLSVFRIGNN